MINVDAFSLKTQELVHYLRAKSLLPKFFEVASVDKYFYVNCFNQKSNDVISGGIYTGFSSVLEVAFLKSLSEYFERKSMDKEVKYNLSVVKDHGTDGLAAYPSHFQNSLMLSKRASFCEAVERFVWSNWWDNKTKANIEKAKSFSDLSFDSSFDDLLNKIINIEEIIIIRPNYNFDHTLEDFFDTEVIIVFVKIKYGGYLSGGACGLKTGVINNFERAFSELIRHASAYKRILNLGDNENKLSFYEERLMFFAANPEGLGLVHSVFEKSLCSEEVIRLPKLQHSYYIENEEFPFYNVHRSLFYNQPTFIGGDLKRLCL